jgi:hypothetical protein
MILAVFDVLNHLLQLDDFDYRPETEKYEESLIRIRFGSVRQQNF